MVDEQFAELSAKLQSMIDAGDLEVYVRRGLIMIGLPASAGESRGLDDEPRADEPTLDVV